MTNKLRQNGIALKRMRRNRSFAVTEKAISLPQALTFWQLLINDPLISLLENEQESSFRGVGCDSLGSIGAEVFAHLLVCPPLLVLIPKIRRSIHIAEGQADLDRDAALCPQPRRKRLRNRGGCEGAGHVRHLSHDAGGRGLLGGRGRRRVEGVPERQSVRASQGLVGARQLEQRLRPEQVTTGIRTLLANLNERSNFARNSGSDSEEIPRSLLLQLLEISNKLGAENESVKCNAVRAIGYLLQLVSPEHMKDAKFKRAVEQCIQTLMANCFKSSFMKVHININILFPP